jgi:hypothetical protein
MRLVKALIFGLSLGAMGGPAFAGEDSTHRLHCTGPAYYDLATLQNFDQSKTECGATVHAG